MRRKGTHFFCFLQISAVKNAEIWKMYLQCVQNTTPYQAKHRHRKIAPLRTKRSIIAARLHLSVPSGASSSQDCTTSYQAEQSCSEPSCPVCCSRCHVWLQHRSVPSRTTIIAISDIYQQRVRTKRCGPFSIKRVINLKFSHSFCCSVAALQRCS